MKVLIAAPYIYDRKYKEFTKTATGFGMITAQIYENIAKISDAYLTTHVLTKGHGHILPHTFWSVIRHMRWKDLIQGIQWACKYKQGISGRLKYLYYCINKGYLRHTLQKLHPDVVHINGVALPNKPFIEVCEELSIKYVVTLHGLLGLDDSVKSPKWNKQNEKEVLLHCEKQNIPVTVISSGIKNRIEQHYLNSQSRCINVVLNGTDTTPNNCRSEQDIRTRYNIPNDAAIAISVGNICANKNQIQTVEAMPLVRQNSQKDLFLFFCGKDCTDGTVQKRIEELGLADHVFTLGFVPQEQLGNLYAQADFNILSSVNDGFGLSVIEAFVYGLPTVTFADLDAVPDLYDESAMLLCKNRDTVALADAICQTAGKSWNRNEIIKYSKQFSLEQMAENYLKVFKKALEL